MIIDVEFPVARKYLPLCQPSRYKGLYGGRSSGKSHFFAEQLIERCLENPDLRAACIREVQKSLKYSAKTILQDKIRQYELESYFTIKRDEIELPGSGVIIFQGMQNHTADSIKSLEAFNIAWIEEAHKISQYSLDLIIPTFREDGSEIWASWNPDLESDPIEFLRTRAPDDSIIIDANYWDNPWLPKVVKGELEYLKKHDYEKYLHIWEGHYRTNSESRVFKNWVVDEFEAPKGTVFYYGADWGFSKDPTVLVRCFIQGNRLFFDYESYKVGCKIVDTPKLFDELVPEQKGLARKEQIIADSARPETIAHMRDNGYPKIVRAKKGPNSVEEGVEFLQNFEIVVHPRCKHLIDELKFYSYKVDKKTEEITTVLEDKKNHVIDSARYALENVRRKNPSPLYGRYANA